jgi:UDP-glucose 4-epimerase
MLIHQNDNKMPPKRVIIFGSTGFVGNSLLNDLNIENIPVIGFGSSDIDLTNSNSTDKILDLINEDDCVVFISSIAPAKNIENLIDNLKMVKNFKNAIEKKPVNHIVYISSDAVYKDTSKLINESHCAEPDSIHGLMHLCREKLLSNFSDRMVIVRPTLIYGLKDPHNGYGPNQFLRKVIADEDIILFGKGEEQRDHVSIETVTLIIKNIILMKSIGVVNVVSGVGSSFLEIANFLISELKSNSKIIETKRTSPMPHNGFRLFDKSLLKKSFPNTEILDWKDGLGVLCNKAMSENE